MEKTSTQSTVIYPFALILGMFFCFAFLAWSLKEAKNEAVNSAHAARCAMNLFKIESAKGVAYRHSQTTNDVSVCTMSADDVARILSGLIGLSCPSGGTYLIGPAGIKPTCSIPEHTLD